ncbi:hypothetical protein LPJ56_007315 [Coemansia sp. RSA 2599]|nr:hypothetical protein LPJ56_007315 [Coemansia sp. RSA 2599]
MSDRVKRPDLSAVPLASVTTPMAPMVSLPGIAPPKFSGAKNEDVFTFCVNMQRYLTLFQLSDEQAMIIMAMHLNGVAGKWFNSKYPPGSEPVTAKAVLDELHDTFNRTIDRTQLRHRFHNLLQKGSVTDYGREFLNLMGVLNIADSPQVIFQFINGLKRETKGQLATQEFHSVQDAILAATKYDSTMFGRSGHHQHRPRVYNDSAMDVDTIDNKGKRVSTDECRRRGLCFYCKESGHRINSCPKKSKNSHQ